MHALALSRLLNEHAQAVKSELEPEPSQLPRCTLSSAQSRPPDSVQPLPAWPTLHPIGSDLVAVLTRSRYPAHAPLSAACSEAAGAGHEAYPGEGQPHGVVSRLEQAGAKHFYSSSA
jgi:hypothetical protein